MSTENNSRSYVRVFSPRLDSEVNGQDAMTRELRSRRRALERSATLRAGGPAKLQGNNANDSTHWQFDLLSLVGGHHPLEQETCRSLSDPIPRVTTSAPRTD